MRNVLRFALQRTAAQQAPTRKLATTFARKAGGTTYRTTMPEMLVRATKDHPDVQVIMTFQCIGIALLIGIFTHGSKDPRYYFGANRNYNSWKKYMTKHQWCDISGRGLRLREPSTHDNGTSVRGMCDWMRVDRYIGLKLDWQKDLYALLIETYTADHTKYVSPKPEE